MRVYEEEWKSENRRMVRSEWRRGHAGRGCRGFLLKAVRCSQLKRNSRLEELCGTKGDGVSKRRKELEGEH